MRYEKKCTNIFLCWYDNIRTKMIDYPLRSSPKFHGVLPARMQEKTSVATMHYADWAEDSVCCTICVKLVWVAATFWTLLWMKTDLNSKNDEARSDRMINWTMYFGANVCGAVEIMYCRIFGWMLILEQNFLKLLYWRERSLVQAIYNGFTGT